MVETRTAELEVVQAMQVEMVRQVTAVVAGGLQAVAQEDQAVRL